MICELEPIRIKLIDFGSACTTYNNTNFPYIQPRFYRSPEILLGLPYTRAIDMWSLGCICAELFLGLPIFPGQSEYDQVHHIVRMFGQPPINMLNAGSKTKRYFRLVEKVCDPKSSPAVEVGSAPSKASIDAAAHELQAEETAASTQAPSQDSAREGPDSCAPARSREGSPDLQSSEVKEQRNRLMRSCRRKSRTSWRLKTCGEYERDEHKKAANSKRVRFFFSLEEMVVKGISEETRRRCFLQFLNGLFQMSPKERWTAKQALQHPFVDSTVQYDEHFQPLPDDVGPAVAWAQPVESISASPLAMSP